MRKVGIMSMQRIANYGSFLQAYALKQLIEEVGCNVEFVDYHVGAPVITENADSKNKVVRKIEKGLETFRYRAPLAHKLSFIRYKQSFAQKYMPLLGIADEMNYNPTVDCLVIGSDEVFNCIQKNSNVGYSPELFGKNNHAKKLITYAASFGNTTLEKLEKYKKANEVGALLKKFDAISVRDANSGTIVEQLTGKEPVYNLDPVLTYDYMNCCDKIPQVQTNEKYLILYAYAGRISNDEADWIAAYAKKKNLKVYAIGGIQKCADRFVDCSPFEVLAYFRNAEEVITDTFHGSIFSVITHRPFTTLIRKSVGNSYGNEEKLSDLLKRLRLANRMTMKIEDAENINEETQEIQSYVFGGERLLGLWTLSGQAGYSKSSEDSPGHIAGATFKGNTNFPDSGFYDTEKPRPIIGAGFYDPSNFSLDKVDWEAQNTQDTEKNIRLDLARDLGAGLLRLQHGDDGSEVSLRPFEAVDDIGVRTVLG